MIPYDPQHPEMDCYTHINNWILHMESLLGRALKSDDCLFPVIASTGHLKFGESLTRAGTEILMQAIIDVSGVLNGRWGKFTTHRF